MCIIVGKKKGVDLPSKTTLENCFDNNSDGSGLAYVKNRKVVIEKGFMTFEAFYKRLMELNKQFDLKNKALLMHFRITTHGGTSKGNCHPFPISNSRKKLKATYLECGNVAFAHNKTVKICADEKEKDMSDTQIFSRDYLYHIWKTNKCFYEDKNIRKIIQKMGGESRFCFLDNKEQIYTIGEFVEDNGVLYSNYSYSYNINYYDYCYDYTSNYLTDTQKDEAITTKKSLVNIKKNNQDFTREIYSNYVVCKKGDKIVFSSGYIIEPKEEDYCFDTYGNIYYISWENQDLIKYYQKARLIRNGKTITDFKEFQNQQKILEVI